MRGPIYVFHNSWYLRTPLTGSGAAGNLRHWNNALLFCEPGSPGYDDKLCETQSLPKLDSAECGTYAKSDPDSITS